MIRILRVLVPASVLAVFLCDATLITASYLGAVFLDRNLDPKIFLVDHAGWQSIAFIAVVLLLGLLSRQLYSGLRNPNRVTLLQELSLVLGVVFICEAVLTYFHLGWAVPRNTLLTGSLLMLASVFLWRMLVGAAIRHEVGLERVLFFGFPPAAANLAAYLLRHPEVGFVPVGYLATNETADQKPVARLGSPLDLRIVLGRHQPDRVVVGDQNEIEPSQLKDLIDLHFGGVRLEELGGFWERTAGRVNTSVMQPVDLIYFERLKPNPLNLTLQSMYSKGAALLALPVALPLMGVVAVLIRAASGAPALVRQRMVGLHGAVFTRYSFHRPPGRLGRVLASAGLERLPQIWNILCGDMSLVGPQPDRPEFSGWLSRAIPFYGQRLLVRPGVLAWTTARDLDRESREDALRRLEYDLYYVKNVSPLLDLLVVLRRLRDALLGEKLLLPEPSVTAGDRF